MSVRKDHLICPNCRGVRIDVRRDGWATRTCRVCSHSWRPAADPADAGGPYVAADERFQPHCGNCGKLEAGRTESRAGGITTVVSRHEDGTSCTYQPARLTDPDSTSGDGSGGGYVGGGGSNGG